MRRPKQASHRIFQALRTSVALFGLLSFAASVTAQTPASSCQGPQSFEPAAFNKPMEFVAASNKGNMTTSSWIAATGEIGPETPARFRSFLETEQYAPGQIVLHSPGGNLAAGLELGHLIREAELTTHIGRTVREISSSRSSCDTWWDMVESGICASSCAYSFLGGRERFVDSPYYSTEASLLGFHQFYGNAERGSDMLTAEEAAEIETSTLSIAQALTGQIVLYAIEMGVDPRVVAFASATPSDNLYYPTPAELEELAIASGDGLEPWFIEPYGAGLVTAAKPRRSTSMLEQITAFCRKDLGEALFLVTMDLLTPSYPNPDDLPLNAVELTIDGQMYAIWRRDLKVRYGDGSVLITVPVGNLEQAILKARHIEMRLDAPRVMGNFREGKELDETERQSLALAWRNCI